MNERQKLLNKNKDDIFGSPGTYKCRVCNADLDDGRKQYCSPKCRKVAYAVYRMYRWKAVRQKVLERDGNRCQICGWSPDDEDHPERHQPKIHVDHIVSLSQGGSPLDSRNLMTICKECHIEKGIEEGDFSEKVDGKLSGYSRGLRIEEDNMPGVPLWKYLPLRSETGMVTGNNFNFSDGEGRKFQCPSCSNWVSLDDALSERTNCSDCGSEIQIQATAVDT